MLGIMGGAAEAQQVGATQYGQRTNGERGEADLIGAAPATCSIRQLTPDTNHLGAANQVKEVCCGGRRCWRGVGFVNLLGYARHTGGWLQVGSWQLTQAA